LAAPVLGLHRPPPRFVLESGAGSFSLDSPSIFVGRYAKVHFQVRIESVDARFECGLDARVWGVIAIRAREAGGRRQGLTNLLQPNSLRSQCRGFFAAAIPVRVPRVVSIMGSARQSGHDTILSRAVSGFLPVRFCKPFAAPLPSRRIEWSGPAQTTLCAGPPNVWPCSRIPCLLKALRHPLGEQAKWYLVRDSKRLC
jgi:hypothetical protein